MQHPFPVSRLIQGVFGDDQVMNGFQMYCSSTNSWSQLPQGGALNQEDVQEISCPDGQAVCGLKTNIDLTSGEGDDTGLNNVWLRCCSTGIG